MSLRAAETQAGRVSAQAEGAAVTHSLFPLYISAAILYNNAEAAAEPAAVTAGRAPARRQASIAAETRRPNRIPGSRPHPV